MLCQEILGLLVKENTMHGSKTGDLKWVGCLDEWVQLKKVSKIDWFKGPKSFGILLGIPNIALGRNIVTVPTKLLFLVFALDVR